jgi:hypothetical protein
MGRPRTTLAAALALIQLGAAPLASGGAARQGLGTPAGISALGEAEPDAALGPADGHSAAPCHETHGAGAPERPCFPLTLSQSCPCGCSLPGRPGHEGPGPALLAVRDVLRFPSLRTQAAARVARAPDAPLRAPDHVPISS